MGWVEKKKKQQQQKLKRKTERKEKMRRRMRMVMKKRKAEMLEVSEVMQDVVEAETEEELDVLRRTIPTK